MAERYVVRILATARRQLLQLPSTPRQRVRLSVRRLGRDPRPRGATLLSGKSSERLWRIRVGDYRVLYEIRDVELVVLVIRIGHRREVYRRRPPRG